MTCQEAMELLDDHIDQALDPISDRAVRSHLRGCVACRHEADALSELVETAGRLPDGVEPGRDLWENIAPRLTAPARRGSRWPLAALAATLLLLLLGGAYILAFLDSTRPFGSAPPPGAVVVSHAPDAMANLDAAERAFAEARQTLLTALEQKRGSLSPETLAMVDENVAIIEKAILEIRGALATDPANLELSHMLMTYHHHELQLLQRVTRQAARL